LPEAVSSFVDFMKEADPRREERPLALVVTATAMAATGKLDAGAQHDGEMANGPRIDFLRYHPLQRTAEETLRRCRLGIVSIRDLVEVRSSRVNPLETPDEIFRYVGLAEIEKDTGVWRALELSGDSIKSTCNVFRAGDIIFARLRPNLRKVVLIPDDDPGGVCSSECVVLRGFDKGPLEDTQQSLFSSGPATIDSNYLVWVLRSDLIQGQILAHVTGVGRPRVATSALLAARLPLPAIDEQRRQARAMLAGWNRFMATRKRAADLLIQAEKEFLGQYADIMSSSD